MDTRCILAFSLTDMGGGDYAQPHGLLKSILVKYNGRGVSLPEPIADILVDSAHSKTRPGTRQTLLDEWMSNYVENTRPESEGQDISDAAHTETGDAQHNDVAQAKQILKNIDRVTG
ncbi:MAG: hypothetical protein F4W68_02955 [Cenarchaeum sp. SB0661_bin_35]|nr:hypothetical protein [Cenarchaeum sp. SB0667_bin_13]MXY37972.1 hypothetical protein [Cenarchaeum sp. SB0664_bin_35]MYC79446.1 hypothetical protein [Cenarchaeum sp. SB0661_bin_35]MYI52211.1 hypothetical protein [Cenarchaeum sp. SB0673_bin_9]